MSKRPRTAEDLRELERWYRTVGYDDGYAGRAAASVNPVYQDGWRKGANARRVEELKP